MRVLSVEAMRIAVVAVCLARFRHRGGSLA
jgi:hypothetical protein